MQDRFPVHPAIAQLPRPRFGYVGNINERLDYSLLIHLARVNPNAALIFVGDIHQWKIDSASWQHLQTMPNVYFLGKFPFADIPALVKGMDVCLLPYVANEHAYFRSPLKLYEYLAAGKPVVATSNPEVIELRDWVYLANDREEWVTAVAAALHQDSSTRQQARHAFAQNHSWNSRVDEMLNYLATVKQFRINDA